MHTSMRQHARVALAGPRTERTSQDKLWRAGISSVDCLGDRLGAVPKEKVECIAGIFRDAVVHRSGNSSFFLLVFVHSRGWRAGSAVQFFVSLILSSR